MKKTYINPNTEYVGICAVALMAGSGQKPTKSVEQLGEQYTKPGSQQF